MKYPVDLHSVDENSAGKSHPRGSRLGARAKRVATAAIASGKALEHAARTCPELREATELWGEVKFGAAK